MNNIVNDIRKVSQCVYIACDADVAADIASKCKAVADSHDKLTEQNKLLREALAIVVDKMPMYKNTLNGYAISLSDDDCRIIKETLNISDL